MCTVASYLEQPIVIDTLIITDSSQLINELASTLSTFVLPPAPHLVVESLRIGLRYETTSQEFLIVILMSLQSLVTIVGDYEYSIHKGRALQPGRHTF